MYPKKYCKKGKHHGFDLSVSSCVLWTVRILHFFTVLEIISKLIPEYNRQNFKKIIIYIALKLEIKAQKEGLANDVFAHAQSCKQVCMANLTIQAKENFLPNKVQRKNIHASTCSK